MVGEKHPNLSLESRCSHLQCSVQGMHCPHLNDPTSLQAAFAALANQLRSQKKRWAVLVMGCTWVLPQFPACYLWFVVCTERDPHSVCPDVGVGAAFRGRLQRRLPAQSQAFRKLCLRYPLLLTYYKYNNKNNNNPTFSIVYLMFYRAITKGSKLSKTCYPWQDFPSD